MPRPSRNVDQLLLEAGALLLPETGCRGLSARRLTEQAGVNLGMFHYHFRSKDNFIRILLDRLYEDMFTMLMVKVTGNRSPMRNLRSALTVISRFVHVNRPLLSRIMVDALSGEQVAMEFLTRNIPRHANVLADLITQAQQRGQLASISTAQALSFIGSAIITPALLGELIIEQTLLPAAASKILKREVLSETALDERIELALRGLQAPRHPRIRKT